MGLKDLFVKSTDTPEIPESLRNMAKKHTPVQEETPVSDFDTTGLDLSNVVSISDIYAKEGIADLTRSIFKVEEIRSVVPAELPTDVKKKTVLGMLNVSGLDVASLLTDASLRVSTLEGAKDTFNNSAMASVSADEAKIADLEAQIDALKQNINATKKTQEAQNAAIDQELARVNDIVKFIG